MTTLEMAKEIFTPPEYERYKKNYTKSRRGFKSDQYNLPFAFRRQQTPEGRYYWDRLFSSCYEKMITIRRNQ